MTPARAGLPDFIIIGAPKAGTTSLYHYLNSHPEIYLSPIKEPRYFSWPDVRPRIHGPDSRRLNREIVWRLERYQQLFAGRGDEKVAGEASATYLWSPASPLAIRMRVPDARLVAILRHPADRAYSHFCHNLRTSREPLRDFRAALAAEDERARLNWSHNFLYRSRGLYGLQLDRYYALFPREQLLIFLYDDLVAAPAAVLRSICRFLGVDDGFPFDTRARHNVTTGVPRSDLLNRLLTRESLAKSLFRRLTPLAFQRALFDRLYSRNRAPLPPFPSDVRQELLDSFRADILRLQDLLDRHLAAWLKE